MKSILAIIVLISLYNCILCDFKDCGSVDGKVNSVSVSGCSAGDQECPLKSGSSSSIDVKFTSNADSSANTLKIWGIIGGLEIPFPMNPSDACKWGLTCPVKSGSSQELKVEVPINKIYPKISLQVKVAVVDSKGANLICTQFPAKIVD